MQILGTVWLGSRTAHYDRMRAFAADVLGLDVAQEQPGATVFTLSNGDAFEVFKPADEDHSHFPDHPVPGFLVADVAEARAELEAKGVEFVGEIQRGVPGENWGAAWTHFTAPDGNLYCLVSRHERHPGGRARAFRELRVCLRVADLDAALRTYEDGLGLTAVDTWTHPDGQRGALLAVTPASVELFDDAQWDFVDEHETGTIHGSAFALRAEVDDPRADADRAIAAGAIEAGPLTRVPWDQEVVRVVLHDGVHLSFSRLDDAERAERASERGLLPN